MSEQAKSSANRGLIAIAGFLFVGLIATFLIAQGQNRALRSDMNAQQAEFEERLADSEETISDLAEAVIPPEVIERTAQSVYLVVRDGQAFGTAWVVDPERGLLATNAHLSMFFSPVRKNMEIKNEATGQTYQVIAAKSHNAYWRFARTIERHAPSRAGRDPDDLSYISYGASLPDGYDVGILKVAIEEGQPGLAPALPIADAETMASLKRGQAIGLIGYPSHALNHENIKTFPDPIASVGTLSWKSPLIFTSLSSEEANSPGIIVHGMPSEPGSSGSPIIDSQGRVIAIQSLKVGGEDGTETQGVGQRIEFLSDLLELLGDDAGYNSAYRESWNTLLSYYPRTADILRPFLLREWTGVSEEDVDLEVDERWIHFSDYGSSERDGTVRNSTDTVRDVGEDESIDDETIIESRAMAGEQMSRFLTVEKPNYFATDHFTAEEGMNYFVFAMDYRRLSGALCPIRMHFLHENDDYIYRSTESYYPSFYFPSSMLNGAHVDFAFSQDDACDRDWHLTFIDREFAFYVISWPDGTDAEELASKSSSEKRARVAMKNTVRQLNLAKATVQRVVRCHVTERNDPASCKIVNFSSAGETVSDKKSR